MTDTTLPEKPYFFQLILAKVLGPGKISFGIAYRPTNFARLIAKIAYSLSVAIFGLENIEDTGILSSIIGDTDNIGKWVGSASDKVFSPNLDLHNLKLELNGSLDLNNPEVKAERLLCRVGLFSLFNTPEYTVVVGNLNKEAVEQLLPDFTKKS